MIAFFQYATGYRIILLSRIIFLLAVATSQAQENISISSAEFPVYPPKILTSEDSAHIKQLLKKGWQQQFSAPDSAFRYFEQAYFLSRASRYDYGIAVSLSQMGKVKNIQGQYEQSKAYYDKAWPYCKKFSGINVLPSTWNIDVGVLHIDQGKYTQAAHYYTEALKEALLLPGDARNMVKSYNNLGTVFIKLQQYDKAWKYLQQGEQIARKKGLKYELAITLVNKAGLYIPEEQYDSALIVYKEALNIAEPNQYHDLIQGTNNAIAELYLAQQLPQKAIPHLEKTIQKGNVNTLLESTVIPLYSLGKAYYQLQNFEEAEKNLQKVLKLAQSMDYAYERSEAHGILSKIYTATGQYKKALEEQLAYQQIKDSLISKEKSKDINELEIKYQTSEKDKILMQNQLQLTLQQQQIGQKNKWMLVTSISTLATVLLLLLLYRNYRHKQNSHRHQLQLIQQQQEITSLTAMMQGEEKERSRIARELHDGIGGMLAAMKLHLNKIRKNEHNETQAERLEEIEHILTNTTNEVRKTAHNLMPDALTRYGMEEALLHYCDSINNSEELQIEIQLHGNLEKMNHATQLIIYRICQELIQNIIKHARAQYAMLQIREYNNKITLIAEDNGIGFDVSTIREGMGLGNLKHRVQHLRGTMTINSVSGKYTTVHIEFGLEGLKSEKLKVKS